MTRIYQDYESAFAKTLCGAVEEQRVKSAQFG